MKLFNIVFIIIAIFFVGSFLYGISDNGRLIRDAYGSGISDDAVKTIWCDMNGFEGLYSEWDGKDFCGNIEVIMDCNFTNKGDHCLIVVKDGGKE